jgi:hypothetical protein
MCNTIVKVKHIYVYGILMANIMEKGYHDFIMLIPAIHM